MKFDLSADPPPPEIEHRRNRNKIFFYHDAKIIIIIIISVTVLICTTAMAIICFKYRETRAELKQARMQNFLYVFPGQRSRQRKEAQDNQKNSDAQRDRYYATIHKVALQAGDKIPGL